MLGHRQAECCQRSRDAENGTLPTRNRQQTTEDRSQYTEIWYAGFVGTETLPPNTATRDRGKPPRIDIYHTNDMHKMKHTTRDAR